MENKNWHIKAIGADEAWRLMMDSTTGDIDYGDIRIAHVDTGYTKHPVFGAWNGDGNNLIVDEWTNFIETDSRDPFDPLDYKGFAGHGTRIGSVMYGDLPGEMRGVAPGCPVVPYRATNSVILAKVANKHAAAIGKAIRHAVDQTDCAVISMSLGTPAWPKKNMGRAVDHAYENGVIVVAASGNNASDHVTYPGKYFRTICAGGLTPELTIWREHADFMRGHIDILAPAEDIYRANSRLGPNGPEIGEYRGDGDGTSYATACTAAAAALWLAHRGEEIDAKYSHPWITTEAFRKMLQSTAKPLAEARAGIETGILNIPGLLTADLPAVTEDDYEHRIAAKQWA